MIKSVSSLIVILASVIAMCGPFADAESKLRDLRSSDVAKVRAVVDALPSNSDLNYAAGGYSEAKPGPAQNAAFEEVRATVSLLSVAERTTIRPTTKSEVTAIKQGGLYRDPGIRGSSSWLSKALESLKNLNFSPPKLNQPKVNAASFNIGSFFVVLVWIVIGAAAVALLIFALLQVKWKRLLARKARALVEEDEPERTLDEWLAQADALIARGKYREAVRALYLACLLRFDEGRVARFDRGQTNWEHLARIESSARLPDGLNFRATTQSFDQIWYGHSNCGIDEVNRFREWYTAITSSLAVRAE